MFTKSAAYYDALYSQKSYEVEAQTLHELIQQHSASGSHTLLDVACGTGGHIPYLSAHYEIEGLDLDDEMLKVARELHPHNLFYQGDMQSFDLGKQFDVVMCLFSSIGYTKSIEAMRRTLANFAHHTKTGGVVIVEPWFAPGEMKTPHIGGSFVDQPDLKITRMTYTTFDGNISTLHFHYLVGTPDNIDYFTEDHALGLFTRDEYLDAFRAAGLDVIYDEKGLMGRGLYIGKR